MLKHAVKKTVWIKNNRSLCADNVRPEKVAYSLPCERVIVNDNHMFPVSKKKKTNIVMWLVSGCHA